MKRDLNKIFVVNNIWISPRGTYYQVTGVRLGQATLRVGLHGKGRITRRSKFATNNWVKVSSTSSDQDIKSIYEASHDQI